MNLYQHFCAPLLLTTKPTMGLRREIVPSAEGRVLEVGMGQGTNLPFYDADKVSFIHAVEPSIGMRRKIRKQLHLTPIPVEILAATAEEMPLDDDSVDTVVLMFTLCTINDWRKGLFEMRRVMKPEGRLLFCEHGLASEEPWRKRQNSTGRCRHFLTGGCRVNLPIADMIRDAGFQMETLQDGFYKGMRRIDTYLYRGVARKLL